MSKINWEKIIKQGYFYGNNMKFKLRTIDTEFNVVSGWDADREEVVFPFKMVSHEKIELQIVERQLYVYPNEKKVYVYSSQDGPLCDDAQGLYLPCKVPYTLDDVMSGKKPLLWEELDHNK